MNNLKVLVVIFATLLSLGCSQSKKIAYYQNAESIKQEDGLSYESKIQPDDLLLITVSSPDPEAVAPFNAETMIVPLTNGQAYAGQQQKQLYLVDKQGNIEFPVLGSLKFGGKTKIEVNTMLKELLLKYVKNPIVNIRIMNFKITVQGEVNKPGSFTIVSERITIPEALSLAGDLTIYGKRNNVILIREIEGKKTVHRIDLTKADFINSPDYYLTQNDLIYVEPNGAKANSSTFNQNIPIWISLSSVVISLVLLLKK